MTFWHLFKTGFAATFGACTALLLFSLATGFVSLVLFFTFFSPVR